MADEPPSCQSTTADPSIDERQQSVQRPQEHTEDCIVVADPPIITNTQPKPKPKAPPRFARPPPQPLPSPPITPAPQQKPVSYSTPQNKYFRAETPCSTKGDYDRLGTAQFYLDCRWGKGQWYPPASLHRSKKPLSLKQTANLCRITSLAQKNGIELQSLYQRGGVIYDAAVAQSDSESPTWGPQTAAWALQLLKDRLGIMDTAVQSPRATVGVSMDGRRSQTARGGKSATIVRTPQHVSPYDQRVFAPASTPSKEPYLPPPTPNLPQKPPTTESDSVSTPSQRRSGTTRSSFASIQIPGLHTVAVRSQTPIGRRVKGSEAQDVTTPPVTEGPVTKEHMLQLQYLSPYTDRNDVAVLSPIDMENNLTYSPIRSSQRPKVQRPHAFFAMVRHKENYWTLLHLQERTEDKRVDIHHYESDPCAKRDSTVRAKLETWIAASFEGLQPSWTPKKCPECPDRGNHPVLWSSGIESLLILYLLMGRRKLPEPRWPTPNIQSWLHAAIKDPDTWKREVDDYLSNVPELIDLDQDQGDGHVPIGSDSGIDVSRDMSLASDSDATEDESGSNDADAMSKKGRQKRSRENSDEGDSSTSEPLSGAPRKKTCSEKRAKIAQQGNQRFGDMRLWFTDLATINCADVKQRGQAMEDAQVHATQAEQVTIRLGGEYLAKQSDRQKAEREKEAYVDGLPGIDALSQGFSIVASEVSPLVAELRKQVEMKLEGIKEKIVDETKGENELHKALEEAKQVQSKAGHRQACRTEEYKDEQKLQSDFQILTQEVNKAWEKFLASGSRQE